MANRNQFFHGKDVECFTNTLPLGNHVASLTPSGLKAAPNQVAVVENEAAIQDNTEEEELPNNAPEDDEDDGEKASKVSKLIIV